MSEILTDTSWSNSSHGLVSQNKLHDLMAHSWMKQYRLTESYMTSCVFLNQKRLERFRSGNTSCYIWNHFQSDIIILVLYVTEILPVTYYKFLSLNSNGLLAEAEQESQIHTWLMPYFKRGKANRALLSTNASNYNLNQVP